MNGKEASGKPPTESAKRCLECAWCSPDENLASVCAIYDKLLSRRDLWRRACEDFEPLDGAPVEDAGGRASSFAGL